MGLSISDGVVAGLRKYGEESYIQFTAPIAPGSQGGGLFDAQARLVGMIQYRPLDGQNINFALPAVWLAQFDARAKRSDGRATWGAQALSLAREHKAQELAQHARRWSQADPDHLDAWWYLGSARLGLQDWQGAESAFREVLKRDPQMLSAAIGAARALLGLKRAQAAHDLLRPFLAQRQEHAELRLVIGLAHYGLGQTDQAQASFDEAARIQPLNREVRYALMNMARERKDARGVLRELRILAQSNPTDPVSGLQLAEAYLYQGRPQRAMASIERVLAQHPSNADAQLWKGIALVALKRQREGIAAIRQSLNGTLANPRWAWGMLGDAYTGLRLWPEAIDAYRAGLKLAPNDISLQQRLGIALKDGGQLTEALALFQKLNAQQPNDALAWRQIGYLNSLLNQSDKAIPAYERSLAIEPQQPKVWRALMDAYHAVGRLQDMRRAYDKLAALDKTWAEGAYRDLLLPYEVAR